MSDDVLEIDTADPAEWPADPAEWPAELVVRDINSGERAVFEKVLTYVGEDDE